MRLFASRLPLLGVTVEAGGPGFVRDRLESLHSPTRLARVAAPLPRPAPPRRERGRRLFVPAKSFLPPRARRRPGGRLSLHVGRPGQLLRLSADSPGYDPEPSADPVPAELHGAAAFGRATSRVFHARRLATEPTGAELLAARVGARRGISKAVRSPARRGGRAVGAERAREADAGRVFCHDRGVLCRLRGAGAAARLVLFDQLVPTPHAEEESRRGATAAPRLRLR